MRSLGRAGLQETQCPLKSRFLPEDPATEQLATLGKSPWEKRCVRRGSLTLRLDGHL